MDPISTRIALGAAGTGVSAESYWFSTLSGSSTDRFNDVAIDSNGNIVAAGDTNSQGTGQFDFLVASYDTSGSLQWQKVSGTTGSRQENAYCLAIDSTGNIVVAGRSFDGTLYSDAIYQRFTSVGGAGGYTVLHTSSGTIQEYFTGAARNASGDIYLAGYAEPAGSNRWLIAKYNSSNTLVWQKTFGGSFETTRQQGKSLALDSSDNLYVVGWTNAGPSTGNDALIAKFNSSGTLQWHRGLGKPGNDFFNAVCLDSSTNVYAVGYTDGPSQEDGLIAKYNSSGTLQWQKTLQAGGQMFYYGVCTDSADNVYVCGRVSNQILIAKYNSSGTVQWQRTFNGSGTEYAYSIQCDGNDNLIIAGSESSSGSDDALLLKLPNDGSLTGTYGGFTYASSSYTDATISLTDAALSFTVSAGSLTSTSRSNTTSTSTLTASTTTL